MNFFIHTTKGGRKVSVFHMNSNHIENTINVLVCGLICNKYKNSGFVKARIKLYLDI